MHILYLEEDAQDYLAIRQLLDEQSIISRLDWAPNYDKAYALNRQHRYDLYLIAYRSIRPQHPFIAYLQQNAANTLIIFLTKLDELANLPNEANNIICLSKTTLTWQQVFNHYQKHITLTQLRQQADLFSTVFQQAFEFMMLLELDGTITLLNQAASQFFEIQPQQVMGQKLWDTSIASHAAQTQFQLKSMLATAAKGQFIRYELEVWGGARGLIIIDLAMSPLLQDQKTRAILVEGRDLTEHKQIEQQLLHANLNDILTGLPNRQAFVEQLEKASQRTKQRQNYHIAVLYIDLDRFRVINESLGHDMGDWLLMESAHRLQACLPPSTLLARSGGDEFMILMDDLQDFSEAITLAQKINQELARTFVVDGYELMTSASIGIAYSTTQVGSCDLLRDADTAMYHAKQMGKSCYAVFNKQMHTQAISRLQIESDLHRALEHQDFVLFYQPQILLSTDLIVGAEALIRFRHPQNGLILPFEFLSVLEDTGLIIKMGEWIVQTAANHFNQWLAIDLPLSGIAVNLSPHQFRSKTLVQDISRAIERTQLNPEALTLEITESLLLENLHSTVKTLTAFKNLGIHITIDDFGTGYSCLNYLKHFPVDSIKINQSFIKGIPNSPEDTAISVATIDMAHALGLNVIAEGVENDEQRNFLQDHGCDFAQGYFYAPPMEHEIFLEWSKQYNRMMQGRNKK